MGRTTDQSSQSLAACKFADMDTDGIEKITIQFWGFFFMIWSLTSIGVNSGFT